MTTIHLKRGNGERVFECPVCGAKMYYTEYELMIRKYCPYCDCLTFEGEDNDEIVSRIKRAAGVILRAKKFLHSSTC